MKKTVLLAGSTGLIGMNLLEKLKTDPQIDHISALVRKKSSTIGKSKKLKQILVDFDALKVFESDLKGTFFICTLGTTIKKAKTQEQFFKVDHDYPLELAKIALKNGARHLIIVSSVGANDKSPIFYNRTKGQLETELKKLDYESIHIIQPSLLVGKRQEHRSGERFSLWFSNLMSFMIPIKYKPIDINIVSNKIIKIIHDPSTGIHTYHGSDIYE